MIDLATYMLLASGAFIGAGSLLFGLAVCFWAIDTFWRNK